MTLRDFLRALVLERFDTVRAGALAMDVPPTTLHSLCTEKAVSYRVPRPGDLGDLLDKLDTVKPLQEGARDEARRLLEEADREFRAASVAS